MLTLLNIRTLAIDRAELMFFRHRKLLYAFFLPAINNLLYVCSGKCWKLAIFKPEEWTVECGGMLSCSLLKKTCVLLFTGLSSNANLFVFCQCLFSVCLLSLVTYMMDVLFHFVNVGANWKVVGNCWLVLRMRYWSCVSRFFMLMATAAASAFLVFCQ